MAHKKSLFTSMLFKSAALIASLVMVLTFTLAVATPVYAYSSYADCMTNLPLDMSRQTGRAVQDFDDNDRTIIQEECRNGFPTSTPTPTSTASATATTTTSATPRVTTRATTTPSAAPSSSVAPVAPTATDQPTNTPAPQASISSQSTVVAQPRSTAQSSTSTSGGADSRPIYDRIVPPKSTDVLTPTFATQNNPSIGGLVNYLFDFAVRRLLPILVAILVLVITWGGFQYIMAQGDSGKAKIAKDTILFGIIGLVLALAALSIVTILNNILLQS